MSPIPPDRCSHDSSEFSDKSRRHSNPDACVPSIPYIAKPIVNARDAIASHVRWKITLLLATRMHEPLSHRATHAIQHQEDCSIQKWLLSKHTLHLRTTPEYRAACNLHTAFHGVMQRIAGLINAGDFDQAEHLLNSPEPFQNASTSLANALMALDRSPSAAESREKYPGQLTY
jgi:hypothetical protein